MNTAIVVLLLLGFSICMVVGLVTVLQNLINSSPLDDDASASTSLLSEPTTAGTDR